ncbi:unnamed protein product [Calypogeia fissa]
MEPTMVKLPTFQILFCCFTFLTIANAAPIVTPPTKTSTSAAAAASGSDAADGYVVEGRIKVEGMGARVLSSKTANIRVVWNGGQKVTYVRPDGYFAFPSVKAGTHLLEVSALGYYFSPVRVDVSARLHGQVRALAVETRRYYADALVLEPLKEDVYYEKREPFSAMSLLKSPMGLMVGFMVVALFLLPKLMDSIDPEEMKRVQEEMRNQPTPSFTSLLQGGRS